ncbi:MAG: UDP-N-acetylmuramate--L-alanine ligase [Candidatus Omnitrophica bacterium]|nr:UDP-N-acetylmuramate--L-alanine ligase [Candidatus Omnitrophota bacterium]
MKKHYHLIGIGGIGMGALAVLLLQKNNMVSGSDLHSNKVIEGLVKEGAKVAIGHKSENIEGADIVVYSSAIKNDNPEIISAKKLGIPVMPRAKLLAQLIQDHIAITVSGAHGKTTTTSMLANLLIKANLKPTIAIGGIMKNTETNANLGKSEYFVAELDESDGSFLYFSPQYSVITNIDREHMDFYGSWDNLLKAWEEFIGKTSPEGVILACGDDNNLLNLLKRGNRRYITYGLTQINDIVAHNVSSREFGIRFDCFKEGKNLGEVNLNIPGRHNALNAMAVIGVGLELKIGFETIRKSLEQFKGVKRRLDIKGKGKGVTVIDDYGHHPTEIKATLEALKGMKKQRLITVFQPHRFSRLSDLMDEFSVCFNDTDHLIITDIYAASEKPLENINASVLCDRIKKNGKEAVYLPKEKIIGFLLDFAKDGDIVLTLGAGDITKVSDDLVKVLKSSAD